MEEITTFLNSGPVHILYLVTPAQTSSHLMTPSHRSSQLVTPRYTSSHLHTPLTIPHNFSRLLTCSKPISKQSTAQNRYKDIKQQTRHQQTVQCSLKHVQDSWRVCNSMYVCTLSSNLVHDSRRPERHSSQLKETPAIEKIPRISHMTQSHRTHQNLQSGWLKSVPNWLVSFPGLLQSHTGWLQSLPNRQESLPGWVKWCGVK